MNDPRNREFVVCVRNTGYKASLLVRRIYRRFPDAEAERRGLLRVVDESGEDYLFPKKLFEPISVPDKVARTFSRAK
jgi:hypothetical protein